MLPRHKPDFCPSITADRGTYPGIQPPYLDPILGWVDIGSGDKITIVSGKTSQESAQVFRLQRCFGCTVSNMACRYSYGGPAFSDRCEHAKMSSSASEVESSPTTPDLFCRYDVFGISGATSRRRQRRWCWLGGGRTR